MPSFTTLSSLHLDGPNEENDQIYQIYALAPRGQLNPAFMIAVPASDVASDVHNMRGFQYTHHLLLLFPPFKTRLELLRSSYANLFPKCGLTGFKNDI
jgi:hypothetical protein